MYWLLLPHDANAGRHLTDVKTPSTGIWAHITDGWAKLLHLLGQGDH